MIRLAQLEDIYQIADIHVRCWHETYTGLIKKEILDQLSVQQKVKLWQAILDDSNQLVIIYENKERVMGFANFYFQPNTRLGEVRALYLLKEYQGQGIGRRLLEHGFSYFKKKDYRTIRLDVLNKNPSRYFYEHLGAKCIGEIPAEEYGDSLKDLVYQWDI